MTTLTVNIDNEKTEKAIKAVLDAFGLDYNIDNHADVAGKVLSKSEQAIFNRLKRSAKQIKLYKESKITLCPIGEVLAIIVVPTHDIVKEFKRVRPPLFQLIALSILPLF